MSPNDFDGDKAGERAEYIRAFERRVTRKAIDASRTPLFVVYENERFSDYISRMYAEIPKSVFRTLFDDTFPAADNPKKNNRSVTTIVRFVCIVRRF